MHILILQGPPYKSKNSPQTSTAQHTAQHSTAQHSTAQHSTAQHSTAQHSTAQHSTAHTDSPRHTDSPQPLHMLSLSPHPAQLPTYHPPSTPHRPDRLKIFSTPPPRIPSANNLPPSPQKTHTDIPSTHPLHLHTPARQTLHPQCQPHFHERKKCSTTMPGFCIPDTTPALFQEQQQSGGVIEWVGKKEH